MFLLLLCLSLPNFVFALRPPMKKVVTSDKDFNDFFALNDYEDLLIDGDYHNNISLKINKDLSERQCHYQHAIQQFFEKLLEDYDNNLLPKSTGNKVELEVHVQDISEISQSCSSFTLDLFVSKIWTDEHLAFDVRQVCRSNITIKTEFGSRIWSLGTCMINMKQATLYKSPSNNAFFIIYSTRTVWQNHHCCIFVFSAMIELAMACHLMQCQINFRANGRQSLKMRWLEMTWLNKKKVAFAEKDYW